MAAYILEMNTQSTRFIKFYFLCDRRTKIQDRHRVYFQISTKLGFKGHRRRVGHRHVTYWAREGHREVVGHEEVQGDGGMEEGLVEVPEKRDAADGRWREWPSAHRRRCPGACPMQTLALAVHSSRAAWLWHSNCLHLALGRTRRDAAKIGRPETIDTAFGCSCLKVLRIGEGAMHFRMWPGTHCASGFDQHARSLTSPDL